MNKSTEIPSVGPGPIACKPLNKPKKPLNFHLADSHLPEPENSARKELLESARHFLPRVGQ